MKVVYHACCSGSLEGALDKVSYEDVLRDPALKFAGRYSKEVGDLYVECLVTADGRPLGFPVGTSYKPFSSRWR
jgi:phosphatidylinositol 3-kinase